MPGDNPRLSEAQPFGKTIDNLSQRKTHGKLFLGKLSFVA